MTEPTRRLPDPTVDPDGKLVAKSALTPQAMTTRGAVAIPSTKVLPVVVVPGIMGTNLRVTKNKKVKLPDGLEHGEAAWAPPNGMAGNIAALSAWSRRDAAQRQRILDGDYTEVDGEGKIDLPFASNGLTEDQARLRGWGEVHWDSYGGLLVDLHMKLSTTYYKPLFRDPTLTEHWQAVMKYDRRLWDAADMPALTEAELQNFARFQYPVYACGYNWTQSNEYSAGRLKQRVEDIIQFWTSRKFDCKQVILVTHSMGGLVARACAKQIPDKIAGVVHGVMPALGAPLAYRRMACGTESFSPSTGETIETRGFATILGNTPALATPAMATSGGALELLPNHLYPSPWLFASYFDGDDYKDMGRLGYDNNYGTYRDFKAWWGPIDVTLVDPAGKYASARGGAAGAVTKAVNQAEKFHRKLLDTFYHPNTYAYYGADRNHLSYGVFKWETRDQSAKNPDTHPVVAIGERVASTSEDERRINFPKWTTAYHQWMSEIGFRPSVQDAPGDGTVSHQSGDGPRGKVRRVFRTAGYDHQGSYKDKHMLMLTHYLIAKIAQEVK